MRELLLVRKLSCLLKIEILNGHLTNRLHHGQVDFLKDLSSLLNDVLKKKGFSQYPEKYPEPFEYPSFNHMLR